VEAPSTHDRNQVAEALVCRAYSSKVGGAANRPLR